MDLTKLGQNLALRTLKPFMIYGIVFLIYYILSSPLPHCPWGIAEMELCTSTAIKAAVFRDMANIAAG